MHFPLVATPLLFALSSGAALVNTQNALYAGSFSTCLDSREFIISAFNASVAPSQRNSTYYVSGTSSIARNDTVTISITVRGSQIYHSVLDPCVDFDISGAPICPLNSGPVAVALQHELPEDALSQLPDDVLTTSDLDAQIQLQLNDPSTNQSFACAQANLTNGVAQIPSSEGVNATEPGDDSDGPPSSANALILDWKLLLFTIAILCGST